jgi:hypothetical protein
LKTLLIGVFPSIQPIKEEIDYSSAQVLRMFEAVAEGWRPLFDPNDKLIVHERDDDEIQREMTVKPTAQQP